VGPPPWPFPGFALSRFSACFAAIRFFNSCVTVKYLIKPPVTVIASDIVALDFIYGEPVAAQLASGLG
jgi:hypothetical protein